MDYINNTFQDLMVEHDLILKATEREKEWQYEGRIALNPHDHIPFAVLLSKSDDTAIGQILFQNLFVFDRDFYDETQVLRTINDLNLKNGAYYYFCLDTNRKVFMRHVGDVSGDVRSFFRILQAGPILIQKILSEINELKDD